MKRLKRIKERQSQKPAPTHMGSFHQLVEELRDRVLGAFKKSRGESLRALDIHEQLQIEDKKLKLLVNEIIYDLLDDGALTRGSGGSFTLTAKPENQVRVTGRVDHVNKKHAFIIIEGRKKDLFVSVDDLLGALDGDTVEVEAFYNRRERREEGRVTKILERSRTELVGTVEIHPKYALVKPDHRKVYNSVFVRLDDLNGAQEGDKAIVKITSWPSRVQEMGGVVSTVLGKSGENDTEMHAILAEFGLPYEFPAEVEKESEKIPMKLLKKDLKGRKDFRETTTFTIDPLDAKDFDDALSIRTTDDGNLEIGVHIADVSHYVQPDSEIDKEAYRRATSVYLVDRTVPMLPEKLSNNLCSLRPNEDRLAFSAVFTLSPQAKILNEWFGRTIIHSDRRFTYEEAQEILDAGKGEFAEELKTLDTLAKKFRTERFKKGAVNFETIEVKFRLDEKGKPLGVYVKERKDSHKLIEEFMLLANRRVAEFVHSSSKGKTPNTMIYRIHDAPDPEKLENFATFVGKLGYKVDLSSEKQLAQSFNAMLEKVEGKPEQNLIESLAVRTMARARYSTEDTGHFGLAFKRYSHFTSPIRRYPDLICHRLLQHYLDGGSSTDQDALETQCKHSSDRERLASEAERASIKYKQVEYMGYQDHKKVFDGIITGVTEFGIFVEITEAASEGLIRMTDLKDDFYDLDKENYRIIGQRTGRIFTFGNPVKVMVKDINLARRSMDLILYEEGGQMSKGTKPVQSRRGGVRNTEKPKDRKSGRRPRRS